jgi:hypothetical protein
VRTGDEVGLAPRSDGRKRHRSLPASQMASAVRDAPLLQSTRSAGHGKAPPGPPPRFWRDDITSADASSRPAPPSPPPPPRSAPTSFPLPPLALPPLAPKAHGRGSLRSVHSDTTTVLTPGALGAHLRAGSGTWSASPSAADAAAAAWTSDTATSGGDVDMRTYAGDLASAGVGTSAWDSAPMGVGHGWGADTCPDADWGAYATALHSAALHSAYAHAHAAAEAQAIASAAQAQAQAQALSATAHATPRLAPLAALLPPPMPHAPVQGAVMMMMTTMAGSAPTFGSAPVIGSAPIFGSAPPFGHAPVVGSAPLFGSAPFYGSTPFHGSAPFYGSTPFHGSAPFYGSTPM